MRVQKYKRPHKPSGLSSSYWTKYWWKYDSVYKYVQMIRSDIPISNYINGLTREMGIYRESQEPVGVIIRDSLEASKNGKTADVSKWVTLMPKIEKIVKHISNNGNLFAKTVINESVAHRYVDFLLQTGDIKYEEKMNYHYILAYKTAVEGNFLKNIDSTMYWLATGYERASKENNLQDHWVDFKKQAKKYYCVVANRKGKRYTAGSCFGKKITISKKECLKCQD